MEKIKAILAKLKDVMSEEDLVTLQTSIETLITEESDKKSDKKAKIMAEEKIKELDELAEKYVEEQTEKVKAELQEEKEKDLEDMENRLIEQLDTFLDNEINEKISDEALEKVALNEVAVPIVEGIKNLFTKHYVELDTEGHSLVKEASEKIESLEDKLSTSIAEKMDLSEKVNKYERDILLAEKVEGLTDNQAKRVIKMFESEDLDNVKTKIDQFVEIVIAEETSNTDENFNVNHLNEGTDDGINNTELNEKNTDNTDNVDDIDEISSIVESATKFA